jgi:hypothetical protein
VGAAALLDRHPAFAAIRDYATLVTDLKAARGAAGEPTTAIVHGYSSAGDGGGGEFYWDETATEAGDDGTIVVPNGAPSNGRWKRIRNPGEYRPEWFGARGDGSSDDTPAVQACINAALADPAGIVLLGADKVYVVGTRSGVFSAILTIASNLIIAGQGYGSCIKVKDQHTVGGDYRVFAPATDTPTSNLAFLNFRIDGNAANNLVTGSSDGDVRRAYMLSVVAGSDIRVEGMWFENCPGRNVIVLGNNSDPPSVSNARIVGCTFTNFGGAIPGNERQNDHSAIYCQADGALIRDNILRAAATDWNPTATATRVVTGLEVHGSRCIAANNHVYNCTHGGHAVATYHTSQGNVWTGNTFNNCSEVGIALWSRSPHRISDLTIAGNAFQLRTTDNLVGIGMAGIYQSTGTGATTSQIQNVNILDNTLYTDDTTARDASIHAIQLCAVHGAVVRGNAIRNWQTQGILITTASQTLDVEDVTIEANTFENVGYGNGGVNPWSIQVANYGGHSVRGVRISNNRFHNADSMAPQRGVLVGGTGVVDVVVDGQNRFDLTNRAHWFANTNNNPYSTVQVLPRLHTFAPDTDPTSGVWVAGQDVILYPAPTESGVVGKVVAAGGGAVSGVWAGATAYSLGQWVRTSGNKVLECAAAGTSAGVEPNPPTLGETLTDGSVTWVYRADGLATFRPLAIIMG